MMDDDVLFADGCEAIAAMFAHTLGESRIVGHELQVGTRNVDDLGNHVQRKQAIENADAIVRYTEFGGNETAQCFRHFIIELDADHLAAAPALQRAFEQAHQVFGLFLHLDIAVADDAESARALDLVAGEQTPGEKA